MNKVWRTVRVAGGLAVGAAYLGVGYLAVASEHPPVLALLVGLLPLVLLVLALAWRLRPRWVTLPVAVAGCAWGLVNLSHLQSHVAAFYFVQHVGAMGLLGLTFGSTLRGGHEQALCSRIATMVTAEPPGPEYLRYTWWVTAVWTAFFALSGTLSVLLFVGASLAWWAFFANLLTPVLVGALFVIEYLVRVRLLPGRPHLSIAGTIQAYQRYRSKTTP